MHIHLNQAGPAQTAAWPGGKSSLRADLLMYCHGAGGGGWEGFRLGDGDPLDPFFSRFFAFLCSMFIQCCSRKAWNKASIAFFPLPLHSLRGRVKVIRHKILNASGPGATQIKSGSRVPPTCSHISSRGVSWAGRLTSVFWRLPRTRASAERRKDKSSGSMPLPDGCDRCLNM